MKIAFFTDVLLPPDGGIEQHVLTTSQALAGVGNKVRVYYPGPCHSGLDPESRSRNEFGMTLGGLDPRSRSGMTGDATLRPVTGISMPFLWPNFRFAFPLHLYFSFMNWKPEVIHFHTSGPMAWAGIIISKLLKIKLVGTFHSYLMEDEYLQNFQLPIFNFQFVRKFTTMILWFYVRSVFNQCDVVVSPSEWVAKDIKNHGINRPIKVVHNGADLAEFGKEVGNEVIEKLRNDYQLSENTLLYVGRLSREKSLDILFKAASLVNRMSIRPDSPPSVIPAREPESRSRNEFGMTSEELDPRSRSGMTNPGCKLLLVGDGPAEGELKKLAGDLGILDNIIFVGRVNHQDLAGSGLFEVSKAFVTASASENQPLTIIEAMAKGLPIIGVSARGVTELVNGNGLLAMPSDENDLANKISQLISDESSRIKMSEESRKMSQDYSLSKAAENLEKLYGEVRSKD